jgi:hypothetical protein
MISRNRIDDGPIERCDGIFKIADAGIGVELADGAKVRVDPVTVHCRDPMY